MVRFITRRLESLQAEKQALVRSERDNATLNPRLLIVLGGLVAADDILSLANVPDLVGDLIGHVFLPEVQDDQNALLFVSGAGFDDGARVSEDILVKSREQLEPAIDQDFHLLPERNQSLVPGEDTGLVARLIGCIANLVIWGWQHPGAGIALVVTESSKRTA